MNALGPSSTPPAAGTAPVPAANVRTAQAAFFRAALDGVAAPQARPEPRREAPTGEARDAVVDTAPPRPGRPGALLDIRV